MVRSETEEAQRTFVPFAEGRAVVVRAGQTLRVSQARGGGQAGDLNVWNINDPREHFWGSRTALYHGLHVTTGDQLHSTWPGERPMMTVVADSIGGRRSEHGALQHDVVMGRCSQRYRGVRYGPESETPGCQEILAAAIEPFGLGPEHVHDAFNVFAATAVNDEDRFFFDVCDARDGDFVDLRAEIDCLVALSACPGAACTAEGASGLELEIVEPG